LTTLTSTDVVNEALNLIGDDMPLVTGTAPTFDSSTAGKAAAQLYTLCVQAVGRQFGWDFARNQVTLTASGNAAPFPMGYTGEYLYPNGIQVWQLYGDLAGAGVDLNNPAPANWSVGNALVTAVQKKVIWTSITAPRALFNNAPQESTWDPLFQMAVVRLLASAMAMAIAGKPDVAEAMLQSGAAFETLAESRED
jgi:hypothetical protein